jgi:signal-transduction protein with cAMP-binding, CBS, and nucleotidyltransferase domain
METYQTAKNIASLELYYIDGLASVRDAIELMKSKHVEALIIQKRNDQDANGIITLTDVLDKVVVSNRTLDEVSVYEIMTKPTLSIPSHLNIKYIPRLLNRLHIRQAPVEENGKYIGMVDFKQLLFSIK